MLVLSRKVGEKIKIGNDVVITVSRLQGGVVKLGIEAPRHLRVMREELTEDTSRSQTEKPAIPPVGPAVQTFASAEATVPGDGVVADFTLRLSKEQPASGVLRSLIGSGKLLGAEPRPLAKYNRASPRMGSSRSAKNAVSG